ncbi:hypothetical protein [Alkalihalobacterium alkalinitrilicum]|uniref:hypothetical protein n=1 Tax=Alkalihalobacterium alkalinitrilicum TaxID=427920 RepID=UPI00099531F9|nr:hypothetical protein [Alkalihalobacterium alkalinitrilicum]
MTEKEKFYPFVKPGETRKEMVRVLTKGLERSITDQEAKIIYWLGDCDPETRGVLLDLFKELSEKDRNKQ